MSIDWSRGVTAASMGAEARGRLHMEIAAKRDCRIRAGFALGGNGHLFNQDSKSNISGAEAKAGLAALVGGALGALDWHGGMEPFVGIPLNNSRVPMDAQTCFAGAAMERRRAHIFAASALKQADPTLEDWRSDAHWLSGTVTA